LAILAQHGFGGSEVAFEGDGAAVVERVRQRGGGVDPFQTVVLERQRLEEGGADAEGMDRGAEVVMKAGERELHRARCAAGLRLGLKDFNLHAGLRKDDGGSKAVGAGADDAGATTASDWDGLRHRSSVYAPLQG